MPERSLEVTPRAPALSSGLFRIAAMSLSVIVAAASMIAYGLFRQSEAALTSEVTSALRADAAVIAELASRDGIAAAKTAIEIRTRATAAGIFLLVDSSGNKLAGNIDRMPPELETKPSGGVFTYRRAPAGGVAVAHEAVAVRAKLAGDATFLVGRDIESEKQVLARMRWLALIGMSGLALAGLFGGYAISRYVLKRVDTVNRTAQSIMAGDMSRRVPVSGTGDEIDGLAHNLNRMLDRIQQLMDGLREVSDNIAHDLKTPLNRLRNRAEAALRDPVGDKACRDGLERIIDEADELIKTFNALLLIARLEAGALEGNTEDTEIEKLVAGVAELYEPVAEERGLSLVLDARSDTVIAVNRHLVGQAVANLIDNAIKYGSGPQTAQAGARASRVIVSVKPSADHVDVSVADNGPGIDQADRARVLKRFVRLERSRSRPGTGLGLSLVAAVARLHGGAIRLEDAKPGLRVVLTLPKRANAVNV